MKVTSNQRKSDLEWKDKAREEDSERLNKLFIKKKRLQTSKRVLRVLHANHSPDSRTSCISTDASRSYLWLVGFLINLLPWWSLGRWHTSRQFLSGCVEKAKGQFSFLIPWHCWSAAWSSTVSGALRFICFLHWYECNPLGTRNLTGQSDVTPCALIEETKPASNVNTTDWHKFVPCWGFFIRTGKMRSVANLKVTS